MLGPRRSQQQRMEEEGKEEEEEETLPPTPEFCETSKTVARHEKDEEETRPPILRDTIGETVATR